MIYLTAIKKANLNLKTSIIFSIKPITFFLYVIASLVFSLPSLAQNNNSKPNLNSVLPKTCVFSAQFEQYRKLKSIPTPLKSSGILFFSCSEGLIWQSQNPFSESLIYTKQQLHFRIINDSDIIPLDGLQHYYLAKFLLSILSADTKIIEEQFIIKSNEDGLDNFVLIPRNKTTKKAIDFISIQKKYSNQYNNDEYLLITIGDSNRQSTKIEINNFVDFIQDTKDSACKATLKKIELCSILKNPIIYQQIENNN